jgi:hypothetical protein
MRAFLLSKSYADCVSAEGAAFIAYAFDVSWGPVHLRYNASISCTPATSVRVQTTGLGFTAPVVEGDLVTWTSGRIGFGGNWTRREAPLRKNVHSSQAGSIHWDCVVPAGIAHVQFSNGHSLDGLGYVERIDLSIAPWGMPIRTVRGGHFIAENGSAVWMEWAGQNPVRFGYLEGRPAALADTSDTAVQFNEGILELSRSKVLREGYLADTVFSRLPDINDLVPRSVLEIEDHKWLSAATLHRPGLPDIIGWAIHEYTVWPATSEVEM